MSAVTTSSPDLDVIGDWSAPEGSERWAKALRIGMQRCVDKVDMYPGELRGLVDKAMQFAAWTKLVDAKGQPFPTFDAFCEAKRPHGLATPYDRIKPYLIAANGGGREAEAKVAAMTKRPEAAPKPGGKRKGAGRPADTVIVETDDGVKVVQNPKKSETRPRGNQPDDNKADSPKYGTDPDYLAARIARDAPDVLEAMKAGKFQSVRAAAKAAGIVKDPDPVTVAARAVAKVPFHRLAELVEALPEQTRKALRMLLADTKGGST